ncbi:hypothetical protein [Comamonas endophytica]|uniref:hypothetical protein n=1 Tax=Comamonas endophytica TaxID=2949090 RepID=UPI001E3B8EA7|nr:hypothetical protein [Acidovorax sp. D4N7]MCD2514045.1 hypothetical protein [Acidovorax sp. D4N7]
MQVRYQAALHADENAIVCQTWAAFWQTATIFQNEAGAARRSLWQALPLCCAPWRAALRVAHAQVRPKARGQARAGGGWRLAIIADSIFSARRAFSLHGLDARCLSY